MEALLTILLDVATPALFAGVVAVLATVVVERFGGSAGGILSSLPTTIVPAAIGIWMRSPDFDAFRRAMAFVPIGILLNAGYLVLWRVIPERLATRSSRRPLTLTLVLSLTAWTLVAVGVMVLHDLTQPSVEVAIASGVLAMLAGLVLGIAANRTARPAPRGTRRVGPVILVVRGVAAAVVIGAAIALSRAGLPVASGIATVFPVIFTTIMVATWLSQGAQVPTGAVGPMALGTLSVSAYALLAIVLFPVLPLAFAATIAWIASVGLVSVPAYIALRRWRAA